MTRLKALFLLSGPTLVYLALSQVRYPLDRVVKSIYAAVIFVVFLACLSKMASASAPKSTFRGLLNGFGILLVFVLFFDALPLGGYLAVPLVPKHSTENADAIFVLAAGTTPAKATGFASYQRIRHGIELLKEKRAPRLFISTGYSNELGHADYASTASFTALFNLEPASLTILIDKSITTTYTEAAYAYKRLSKEGCKKILLVTSGDHLLRSIATFKRAGFEVLAAPAHNKSTVVYANTVGSSQLSSLHTSLHEIVGYCWYYLCGRL